MFKSSLLFFCVFGTIFATVISETGEEKAKNKCILCRDEAFVRDYIDLWSKPSAGRSIAYADQLEDTPCEAGKYKYINCYHSCVRYIIYNTTVSEKPIPIAKYFECSHESMRANPEIEEGLNLLNFHGNYSFFDANLGKNLALGVLFNSERIMLDDEIVEPTKPKKSYYKTIFYVIIGVFAVTFSLIYIFCRSNCCRRKLNQNKNDIELTKDDIGAALTRFNANKQYIVNSTPATVSTPSTVESQTS